MNKDYTTPAKTHIGHVHLKVSDLDRALEFYRDLLGFELTTMYGDNAAFLSAGGYHHHIGSIPGTAKAGRPRLKTARDFIIPPFCIPHVKTWLKYCSA